MNKITKSSKQNQTKIEIDQTVFALPESEVRTIAKENFGYELTDEELKAIQPAMDCFEIAASPLYDAIIVALHFIIDPARCNWNLVNPEEREASMESLQAGKEYFYGTRCCEHPVHLTRLENPAERQTPERK